MCKAIFGLPDSAGTDHPRTPDDLRRCVLFLDATAARDRIEKVAAISPEWAALVGVWDTLTSSLEEEMAAGPVASKTYALIQSLLTIRPVAA